MITSSHSTTNSPTNSSHRGTGAPSEEVCLVEAQGLCKSFGGARVVDDFSLRVARGESIALIGPNGAGKSTSMRILAGFVRPDKGSVRLGGLDPFRWPIEARRLLGYLPEGSPLWESFTPYEFLSHVAKIRVLDGSVDAVERVIEQTELAPMATKSIENLSKGYRRRVALAAALLPDAPILMLDEPTDGLDPNQAMRIRELVLEIAADKALIISTHILTELELLCQRVCLLDGGRLRFDGSKEEFLGGRSAAARFAELTNYQPRSPSHTST